MINFPFTISMFSDFLFSILSAEHLRRKGELECVLFDEKCSMWYVTDKNCLEETQDRRFVMDTFVTSPNTFPFFINYPLFRQIKHEINFMSFRLLLMHLSLNLEGVIIIISFLDSACIVIKLIVLKGRNEYWTEL